MADTVDYQDLLTNVLQPIVVDNTVLPSMAQLYGMFTQNTNVREGQYITDPNCISETAAGGAFTRSDGDPESMTVTWGTPQWRKVYYQEAAKVRKEDIKEANGNREVIGNILQDAAQRATKQLMNTHVFSGCMTQIKADVDSASTYGGITRVTALQSYEENTNATITLAYVRAMYKALMLKKEIMWNDYITIFEPTVWSTFWPLVDALVSKTRMNPAPGDSNATGYQDVNVFDLCPIAPMYGMTTGDVFCLDRSDVQIQNHCALELTWKTPENLNEWGYKVIARIGVNAWVRHPAFQGKLTLKD
jgi:hypothetical protein